MSELKIIFGNVNEHAGHPGEWAAPYLTITISANTSSSMAMAANISNPTTADPDGPVTEGAARPTVQANSTLQPTALTVPSPLSHTGDLPDESVTPSRAEMDSQREMSRTLDHAEEAMDTVKSWKNTVNIIKRVMDTVSPILEVCPLFFPSILF
jgi:hypothetical protein